MGTFGQAANTGGFPSLIKAGTEVALGLEQGQTEGKTRGDTGGETRGTIDALPYPVVGLRGLQRKMLYAVAQRCQQARSEVSPPITMEELSQRLSASPDTIKSAVKRLQSKGFLTRVDYKAGRGGWSRYSVAEEAYRENPIAAFPILSHFDIKREYNPATGEQSNVIVENVVDRPWYERDWIRVDWAESDVAGKSFYGAGGQLPYEARFFVQPHEQGAEALRVVDRTGEAVDFEALKTVRARDASRWGDQIEYFDMVGRFLLEPESVAIIGASDNPARIAIDLSNTTSALAQKVTPVAIGMARSVTAIEAGDRTRVVINLLEQVTHQMRSEGNKLYISLDAGGGAGSMSATAPPSASISSDRTVKGRVGLVCAFRSKRIWSAACR